MSMSIPSCSLHLKEMADCSCETLDESNSDQKNRGDGDRASEEGRVKSDQIRELGKQPGRNLLQSRYLEGIVNYLRCQDLMNKQVIKMILFSEPGAGDCSFLYDSLCERNSSAGIKVDLGRKTDRQRGREENRTGYNSLRDFACFRHFTIFCLGLSVALFLCEEEIRLSRAFLEFRKRALRYSCHVCTKTNNQSW